MLSTYPTVTVIGLLTITCLYLSIFYFQKNRIFQSCLNRYFSSLVLLLFIFHLVTAFALGGEVADVKLFASAGYALLHQIDIYLLDSSHGTYPFLPFTIYPYALFWYISSRFSWLTFSFLTKTLLIPVLFLTADFKNTHFYTLASLPYMAVSYLAIAANEQSSLAQQTAVLLALLPWTYSIVWLYTLKLKKLPKQ